MTANLSKSMAIGIVFFNPARSKRLLMNYLYVLNWYRVANLPVFTLELLLDNAKPEIADAFYVRGSSYMFHKERLCRLLEQRIPEQYTKLIFVDADVTLSDGWYSEVSDALDDYDVVQPFEVAHWLDLTYTQVLLTRKSAVLMNGNYWDHNFHPGFAWAFRRDWFCNVGFFDWGVTGSGDALSAAAWLDKQFLPNSPPLATALKQEYQQFCTLPKPRISFSKGGHLHHFFHGKNSNRLYYERHKLIEGGDPINTLIYLNQDGVFEWYEPEKWNPLFLNYFLQRQDDFY